MFEENDGRRRSVWVSDGLMCIAEQVLVLLFSDLSKEFNILKISVRKLIRVSILCCDKIQCKILWSGRRVRALTDSLLQIITSSPVSLILLTKPSLAEVTTAIILLLQLMTIKDWCLLNPTVISLYL